TPARAPGHARAVQGSGARPPPGSAPTRASPPAIRTRGSRRPSADLLRVGACLSAARGSLPTDYAGTAVPVSDYECPPAARWARRTGPGAGRPAAAPTSAGPDSTPAAPPPHPPLHRRDRGVDHRGRLGVSQPLDAD